MKMTDLLPLRQEKRTLYVYFVCALTGSNFKTQ